MWRKTCILLIVLCAVACGHSPVAYEYRATPVDGWEPGDTLRFQVDTIRHGGTYNLSIGLRTSVSEPYPYQTLWLGVRQHWHNPERVSLDTVECRLNDPDGDVTGDGVSLYQYEQVCKSVQLTDGDYGEISVFHIMSCEILPGIREVGIKVERQ